MVKPLEDIVEALAHPDTVSEVANKHKGECTILNLERYWRFAPQAHTPIRKILADVEASKDFRRESFYHPPSTMTIATRYGNGRVKLKESSSGATAGSPSIVRLIARKKMRNCVPHRMASDTQKRRKRLTKVRGTLSDVECK